MKQGVAGLVDWWDGGVGRTVPMRLSVQGPGRFRTGELLAAFFAGVALGMVLALLLLPRLLEAARPEGAAQTPAPARAPARLPR
jgi:hypothetical protein